MSSGMCRVDHRSIIFGVGPSAALYDTAAGFLEKGKVALREPVSDTRWRTSARDERVALYDPASSSNWKPSTLLAWRTFSLYSARFSTPSSQSAGCFIGFSFWLALRRSGLDTFSWIGVVLVLGCTTAQRGGRLKYRRVLIPCHDRIGTAGRVDIRIVFDNLVTLRQPRFKTTEHQRKFKPLDATESNYTITIIIVSISGMTVTVIRTSEPEQERSMTVALPAANVRNNH